MKKTFYISAFVITAFIITGVGSVSAQDANRIQTLLNRVQTLQNQLNGNQPSSNTNETAENKAVVCPDLNKDLSMGDRGSSVQKLQRFLNKQGFTVAKNGPGSPGSETTYFGPATQQAVSAFQNEYAPTVLNPLGLSRPTGVWADSSQAKAEELCKNTQETVNEEGVRTSGELSGFASREDFRTYIENSRGGRGASFDVSSFSPNRSVGVADDVAETTDFQSQSVSEASGAPQSGDQPDRFSKTNVQEQGIDEPDILKTDGEHLYLSQERRRFYRQPQPTPDPMNETQARADMPPPQQKESMLRVIDALPPEDMAEIANVEKSGDLLLSGDTLVVLSDDGLAGIDVSNPSDPQLSWETSLSGNQRIQTARLKNGKIQLVTKNNNDRQNPCPIKLNSQLDVRCGDVLHPEYQVDAEMTYHVSVVSPEEGTINHKLSFVGASDATIYVSDSGMFIGYTEKASERGLMLSVLEDSDLVEEGLISRLRKVSNQDLSERAKRVEFEEIIKSYIEQLSEDERLTLQNNLRNAFKTYVEENKRELTTTHLLRLDVSDGEVTESGEVPGKLLNQFSLDEHNGYLRLATTVGERFGSDSSANDVYVLDEDLDITGSVKDLGLDERIYSARFMEDTAYVVTFRQIDPFYVLDLSNPENPQLRGEVKLPGYSSYLHPLPGDRVIGIGEEGGQVKATLFDVSDKDNPSVLSSYIFDEYSSDAVENHHAFLADTAHDIVFVPGQKGGYVLSYKNNELTLEKSVANISAKRALYINDTLYVIGENKVVAVDETDWTRTKTVEFK